MPREKTSKEFDRVEQVISNYDIVQNNFKSLYQAIEKQIPDDEARLFTMIDFFISKIVHNTDTKMPTLEDLHHSIIAEIKIKQGRQIASSKMRFISQIIPICYEPRVSKDDLVPFKKENCLNFSHAYNMGYDGPRGDTSKVIPNIQHTFKILRMIFSGVLHD